MSDSRDPERSRLVGLCWSCTHRVRVVSSRGSEFSLCQRSREEPDVFPKYPRLPVLNCSGWQGARNGLSQPDEGPR